MLSAASSAQASVVARLAEAAAVARPARGLRPGKKRDIALTSYKNTSAGMTDGDANREGRSAATSTQKHKHQMSHILLRMKRKCSNL